MSFGQLLGCSREGSFHTATDPFYGYCDHLALLGRELGQDIRLEAAQHQTLLQQQL